MDTKIVTLFKTIFAALIMGTKIVILF